MASTLPAEGWRVAMAQWLAANGIDPNTVPVHSYFVITDEPDGQRLIRYTEYVLTGDGKKQVDPQDPDEAWIQTATAACKEEPAAWLNVPGGRP
jgi:hypothetical protein